MEILKILNDSGESLILEDLDFFETELATGEGYDEVYIQQCKEQIDRIRKWMTEEDGSPDEAYVRDKEIKSNNSSSNGIVVELDKVVPENASSKIPQLSPTQQIQSDLRYIRERTDYKSAFKKYVKDSQIINSDFLDKNFSLFDAWEMDAIVSVKQLGEEFLEKYFGAIDHDKIARYQLFSENYFMKHFTQMDVNIVLEHGKNEWCKKENRSKQLDVFLRLKGVKI